MSGFSNTPGTTLAQSNTRVTGPPNNAYFLMDPEHPLPAGYGYIAYVHADGSPVDWSDITYSGQPKAKWVGPTFTGQWAPGTVRFVGGRKRRAASKKRKTKKRSTRRRR